MSLSGCAKISGGLDEPDGFITAVGKDIYTAASGGEKILLRGVNAGGWLVTEDWMCPTSLEGDLAEESGMFELWDALESSLGAEATEEAFELYRAKWWTEADFDNVKALGLNSIRLPFSWRDLENTDGTLKPDAEAFYYIDWFIENAAGRGLYVVLDLHGAHGSQNGKHHSGDTRTGGALYSDEENMARTEALWVRVANRYKNNKWVAGYDLLNEPEGVPGGTMSEATPHWAYYDRLYKSVRNVDTNHLIFIEAVWELFNLPAPEVYGWTNVAYELHFYQWEDSDSLASQEYFLGLKLIIDNACDYDVPVYIGEFTFFNNPDSWAYGLAFFKERGYSWAVWTYKAFGKDSSWGLYTAESRTSANVVTKFDTLESILEKWGNLETSVSFTPNEWLIEIIKDS